MKFLKPFLAALMLSLLFVSCRDECKDTICNNGGVCINGQCDCPDRYTGPACNQEKTPASVRVGSVSLISMPPSLNGSNWDAFDGPDIYFTIEKDAVIIETSQVIFNSFTGTWNTSLIFNDPAETYVIRVYDQDTLSPDFVGGISFSPYSSGLDFPLTLSLNCPECTVSLSLTDITYTF